MDSALLAALVFAGASAPDASAAARDPETAIKQVLGELDKLRAYAPKAKAAQKAGGFVQSQAAKEATADGFIGRNSSVYKNSQPYATYR